MKHLIVLGHPNPESFCSSLTKELHDFLISQGDEARIRNLYEIGFNPVLSANDFSAFADNTTPDDIKIEQEYIKWADHIIFIYPVWWGAMPAILKGYVDRVFSEGFAYEYVANGSVGLLKPRKGSVICTTGAPTFVYKKVHDAMDVLSKDVLFDFMGIEPYKQIYYGAVPSVTDEVRKGYIENAKQEFAL